MKLRLAGIIHESVVDGPGFRSVVFVQGCPHHCPGCHSPHTQPFKGGKLRKISQIAKEILARPLLDGVTFSGGEPFSQPEGLSLLAKELLKNEKVNLWIYTGYLFEQLQKMVEKDCFVKELLAVADVLVDGPFVLKLRDLSLPFRGSSNQRLVDLKKTLAKKQVILWQPPQS